MKVTVETLPQRQVLLNIEAEPEEVEESKKVAYRRLVHRARIPGFRRGKAPMAMLERYLGKAALLEEAIQHLIPDATNRAIEEQNIESASVPDIEISGTEPVTWKATVSLAPTVDLGDYLSLRVERVEVTIGPEEVDTVLEEIRFQQAPWEPVDRKTEMGDLVTMDVHAEEGGKSIADDSGVQFRPTEESIAPVPGFSQEIIGMAAGETKAFAIAFPDDDERKELAGKEYAFKVTAQDIKAKNLPAIDDEFAKGVDDGYDSLEDLRMNLTNRIKENKEREAADALRDKAVDQLVEMSTVEFPPTLIEHEAEHMLEEQARRMSQAQGQGGLEKYIKTVGESKEDLLEELKPAAQERIVRSLVITEFKDQQGIDISSKDIDDELDKLTTGEQGDQLRHLFGSEAGRQSLERTLLTQKTLKRLEEIITGESGKGEPTPETESEKEQPANVQSP